MGLMPLPVFRRPAAPTGKLPDAKFIRAVIGTNNIDCCACMPLAHRAGYAARFGTGAATNSVEDLKYTDCIMVIGANPTDAHPVTGAKINSFMKGKPTIVIDPQKPNWQNTPRIIYNWNRKQCGYAEHDAVLHYYRKLEDKTFIENRTEGYDDFCNQILKFWH